MDIEQVYLQYGHQINIMNTRQKLVIDLLEKIIENIKVGNCELDDEECIEAITHLSALNYNIYNVTKREACDKILHCAPSTFELYRTMGIIPEGHHDYGSKEDRWSKNDLKSALAYRKKK